MPDAKRKDSDKTTKREINRTSKRGIGGEERTSSFVVEWIDALMEEGRRNVVSMSHCSLAKPLP